VDTVGALVDGIESIVAVTLLDDTVMSISSLCVDVCRWFPSRTHRDPHKLGEIYAQVAARLVTRR